MYYGIIQPKRVTLFLFAMQGRLEYPDIAVCVCVDYVS